MKKTYKRFLSLLLAVALVLTASVHAFADGPSYEIQAGTRVRLWAYGDMNSTYSGGGDGHVELSTEDQHGSSNAQQYQNLADKANRWIKEYIPYNIKQYRENGTEVRTEYVSVPVDELQNNFQYPMENFLYDDFGFGGTGAFDMSNYHYNLQGYSSFEDATGISPDIYYDSQRPAFMDAFGFDVTQFFPLPEDFPPIEFPDGDWLDQWAQDNQYNLRPVRTTRPIIEVYDAETVLERAAIIRQLILRNSIADRVELLHVQEIKCTGVEHQQWYTRTPLSLYKYRITRPDGSMWFTDQTYNPYFDFVASTEGTYKVLCQRAETKYRADRVHYVTVDKLVDAKTGFLIWSWTREFYQEVNENQTVGPTFETVEPGEYTIRVTPGMVMQWKGTPYSASRTERRK